MKLWLSILMLIRTILRLAPTYMLYAAVEVENLSACTRYTITDSDSCLNPRWIGTMWGFYPYNQKDWSHIIIIIEYVVETCFFGTLYRRWRARNIS